MISPRLARILLGRMSSLGLVVVVVEVVVGDWEIVKEVVTSSRVRSRRLDVNAPGQTKNRRRRKFIYSCSHAPQNCCHSAQCLLYFLMAFSLVLLYFLGNFSGVKRLTDLNLLYFRTIDDKDQSCMRIRSAFLLMLKICSSKFV